MLHHTESPSQRSLTCPKCKEWRLKFSSVAEDPCGAHDENQPCPTMVIETQRIFRRSLPPESVLERAAGGSDAPKFNEIVVVTTRRGEEQHSTKFAAPSSSSPNLLKRHREFLSKWNALEEDEDDLRNLRNRVERYRKDLQDRDLTKPALIGRRLVHEDPGYYPGASTSSYVYRPRCYTSSYDDSAVTYRIPAVSSASSAYSRRYCHSHPPTSGLCHSHPPTSGLCHSHPPTSGLCHSHPPTSGLCHSHPPTSGLSLPTTSRSYSHLPSSHLPTSYTAAPEWHFCPATRRLEPAHHRHYYPSRATTDISRRTRSEQRSTSFLDDAGLSLEKLRADLRNTANKFSKHRQMIDRYLNLDVNQRLENVEPVVIKKYDEVAERIPELLLMNYGLYRRPINSAMLWSTSIDTPPKFGHAPVTTTSRLRNATPFEIRGRIRSVVSKVRTAQSEPR